MQPNIPMTSGNQVQGTMDTTAHKKQWQDICKQYHHHFVQVESTDGRVYEGIIDGTDDENVYLLVPMGDMETTNNDSMRQFVPFGYYPRRFRRFHRFGFPFFFLRNLFFPFFY